MIKIFENEIMKAEFFMKGDEFVTQNNFPHVKPSQVHGKNIICVNDENIMKYALPERPEADGVLLMASKAQASLRFADCTPVIIWDNEKNFAMILHSGYKGTVLKISCEGINLIREKFGSDVIKNLQAWIGPCIGRKNYGRNVENDEWTLKGMKIFHSENYDEINGKIYFDMPEEIKKQLLSSGLKEKNILMSGIDTFTNSRCYSYRRGDKTERMTLHVYKYK